MHAALTVWLTLALALPTLPAAAGPATAPTSPPKSAKIDPSGRDALAAAREAWGRGDFSTVRALLEPLAADITAALEPAERENMLLLLADAWLGDKSLDSTERREQAATYLNRLMEASDEWRMPNGTYSPELYDLYRELRIERAGRAGQECEASLVVCKSDLAGSRDEIARERNRYDALQRRYDAQEVEVRNTVKRTRVLAAIPLGFGHFYNGSPALGGSFLAAEAILGAAGLGLVIQRTVVDGCRRTRGFQSGSLTCDLRGEDDQAAIDRRRDAIVRRRQAEEVVGWLLLGAVAVDIVVAQILFKATRTESVRRVPRRSLEAEGKVAPTGPKTRPAKRRASLRAAPMVSPRGAGVGVHVRF